MLDLIRASALKGYAELVRELGGDPRPILADSHVRPELLGNTEAYIPFRTVARVIDRAATELACPDFSLRLAARQSIEILGPIALIARHSPTARDALEGIAEHMGNYSPALRIGIEPSTSPQARYTFEVLVPSIPSLVQIYQLGLGVSLGIFRLLIGPSFRPVRVALPTTPTAAAEHERFFGCPVAFDSDYAGLELTSADLDKRRSSDDPLVREHVARYLDAEGPADDDLVAQVIHLIDRTLSTGHANTTTIAAHLGLHPRTLHRWLAKRDETFERLLDNVRREKATHYLTESGMPLSRIAGLLGYSQQSCLTRSCIRWFDASPRDIRASVASR
jgi:AraC-like DNA-binding protein